ncbi:MAG: restriction endonuclease subunit S [Veillonella sp.]|uniref:restriction endonuclease subunit S n=1 Tax=Veillonella sp. TaxID=1926307 RepID=UPI0029042676|nr:restriction endonuclease subunit S [Veillonella sp.]MDU2711600.1 restriction endonuclease subunit S [Veillonella sp.]
MINQVEKKNPKRRFKEFLGKENWNVHTLGTVLMSMYNGQTPSRSKGEYWNGKINWLTSGELNCGIVNDTFEKITELGLDSANLKIIPKGILVIAITGLEASGTRGNCAILGCNTTLNQSCMALFPIRSLISSDFLFNWYLFIGDYYGIKYTQGTKQQSYNSKILNDLEIVIPSLDEQNKISGFFSKLDSMIDFQKRKLNKLQATKKALLQEMFPEKGQDKPKRRFKGFIDAWEQCKLSDITEVIMGQSPSSKNYTDNPNDDILVQGNADLKDGKVVPRLWTKEITKTIDKGGIILTVRAPVGDVAKTDYKVVLGRGVAGIKGNDYIYQFLQKLQYNRYWVSLSSGSTFESINSNDIKDLIIDIPSIEEQTKISMLLNNVNSIITLHQRKLDKLKNLKQAYLNEMFV